MFHWVDYLIFILLLSISTGIGIFYAVRTKKSNESGSNALLTGGKKLKVVPVTLSLLASFMSAIFILGSPAEVYSEGGIYWWISTGNVPAIIFTAIFHCANILQTLVDECLRGSIKSGQEHIELF